jgi:hypothetical protein
LYGIKETSLEYLKAIDESGGRQAPKVYIADSLIKHLNRMGEDGLGPLRRIIQQLVNWRDFSSVDNEVQAKLAIERLRNVVRESDMKTEDEKKKREEEKKIREEEVLKRSERSSRLSELKTEYYRLISTSEPHERGYDLERLLYELFKVFELNPNPPFKNVGEQIDGSFTLHDDDFLLEAQWEKHKPAAEDIYGFQGKVSRKYSGTRGLYISIQGFSPTCLQAIGTGMQPNVLLMDGEDLVYVLEERINLDTLLEEKRKHAASTGIVYCKAKNLL